MAGTDQYLYLNAFLAKPEHQQARLVDLLAADRRVNEYALDQSHGYEGTLFVKRPEEKRPRWGTFLDRVTGQTIRELGNKSSSSVLFLRVQEGLLAFTFGYGRFLIDTSKFAQDFGIKTALNTLNHETLRAVDLHTLDDQPIQKRAQAIRESKIDAFGIDISRDVLRAVTGSPKAGIGLRNIAGGDAVFSFGKEMRIEELPDIASRLIEYYKRDDYKTEFAWVDNIRRIKDKAILAELDEELVAAIKRKDDSVVISIPELVKWDTVLGFSFTRAKSTLSPTIDSRAYLDHVEPDKVTLESIKRDKLFVYDVHENETSHSIYKSIYFEVADGNSTNVLFAGVWYEVDNSFMSRINTTLAGIDISGLPFPAVYTWTEGGKHKIEPEGEYNTRAAADHGYYLLDKKLVRSDRTTSPIEFCDLMTRDRQLVHVKHRKGGSSGLSHLFAQGSVSAEVMIADKQFRKEARKVLKKVHADAVDLVLLDNPKSSDYEVVFLILGEGAATIKDNLPFFSKVNLANVYDSLSQRGFKVAISGSETTARDSA
jgi:uncharacterized protein (TIGR04141 family)